MVIAGPSGVGKTSIVHAVLEQLGGHFSISTTTRQRTSGEVDGRDYKFISTDEFLVMIRDGAFLEYALVFDRDWYGTPRDPVLSALSKGTLVILDIDVQGAIQVRQNHPLALLIFIDPPDETELLRRLTERGRDEEDIIRARFAEAQHEMQLARSSAVFDAFIVNDSLDETVASTCRIITERREHSCT